MKIFASNGSSATAGVVVEEFTLKNGTKIPAVTVGEDGRGRSLGVLPVKGASVGQKLLFGRVGQSTTGRPVLIAEAQDTDPEHCLLIARSDIGYRGGNTHTGDRKPEFMGLDVVPGGDGGFLPWPGNNIVTGTIAQGTAGNMGSGSQMVSVMPTGVVWRVNRSGRLYGAPSSYYFRYDGEKIEFVSWDERVVADLWMPITE